MYSRTADSSKAPRKAYLETSLSPLFTCVGERAREDDAERRKRARVHAEELQHVRVAVENVHHEETAAVLRRHRLQQLTHLRVLAQVVGGAEEEQVRPHAVVPVEHHLHVLALVRNDQRQRVQRDPLLQQLHRHLYGSSTPARPLSLYTRFSPCAYRYTVFIGISTFAFPTTHSVKKSWKALAALR